MSLQDRFRLYSSITVPSTMHGYSMACAYMQRWFLKRFDKNYFKTINVDETHMSRAFDRAKILKNLKALKPSVFIVPKFDFDFDREGIDLNLGGIDTYRRRDSIERSFFKDIEKNMHLSMDLEQLQIAFSFKVRVSTRAQQLDLFRFMQVAFRIKQTQQDYVDMDFHIPNAVISQIAKDSGFELDDKNMPKNTPEFIKYMNAHSAFPILYKYRTVNGNSEYFVRINDLYIHISCMDNLSADDGEMEGQLKSNYIIEMNCILKIPVPKFYVYYSRYEHNEIIAPDESTNYSVGLFNIVLPEIPDTNSKGWDRFLYTEIIEKERTIPLDIEIAELFEGSEIEELIDNNIANLVSPFTFLEIKLFNNGKEIDYNMDWENEKITSKDLLKDETTYMAVYVDKQYMNEQIISNKQLYKDKLR